MPRLGILVPSSNTTAEPLTYAMLQGLDAVTAHFTRFALPPSLDDAVTIEPLSAGAALLRDAVPDAVAFHGTSGSWTGAAGDRALAAALTERTGAPATTATLATLDALRALGARRVALVFPGPRAIADQIAAAYAAEGIAIATVAAGELPDNPTVGAMRPEEVRALLEAPIAPDTDVVASIGTNFGAAPHAEALERDRGVALVDSGAATTWRLLALAGVTTPLAARWGALARISSK